MGNQSNHKFFYESVYAGDFNNKIEDHRIRSGGNISPEDLETAQEEYKKSQAQYSENSRDNRLLAGAMQDPTFEYYSKETKILFCKARIRVLEKLLVNSVTANRSGETDQYTEQRLWALGLLAKLEEEGKGNTTSSQKKAADKKAQNLVEEDIINKTAAYLKDMFTFNPTAFIRWAGTINLYRMSYTFSRISLKNTLLYLQSLGIIDQNGNLNGVSFNIAIIDAPNDVFNHLSVCIFLARISVMLFEILQHTFAPTNEAEKAFSGWGRFKIEVGREWSNLCNDSWWVFINAITNFPQTFHLVPIAGWVLTGALFFDVGLLLTMSYYEEQEVAAKIQWLEEQIESNDPYAQQNITVFSAMLRQAKIQHTGFRAMIGVVIFATVLFIVSLALTLSLTSPLAVPIGFFVCIVAAALIFSRGNIQQIAQIRAELCDINLISDRSEEEQGLLKLDELSNIKRQHKNEISRELSAKEAEAWKAFALTFAEHVFVPIIIVGMYTLCWPAAVVLTVIYVIHKCVGSSVPNGDKKDPDAGADSVLPSVDVNTGVPVSVPNCSAM